MKKRKQSQVPNAPSGGGQTELAPLSQNNGLKRWLRFLFGLASTGLFIAAMLLIAQLYAPERYKPSIIVAEAESAYELYRIRETLITKADAEKLMEMSRVEGAREAEIGFQEKFKELEYKFEVLLLEQQQQLDVSLKAYESLYERTNMIYQVAANMEAALMQFRQQATRSTQGGKAWWANVFDFGCPFMSEACQASDELRYQMSQELNRAGRHGFGGVSQDMLRGIPDPAQLQAELQSLRRQ